MKFLIKLLGPAALLAFASFNASAATCGSLAGASLSSYQTAGSCSIGNLTFSNFQFEYSTNVSQGSANVPDPLASTFITISSTTDSGTCDPNGTCGDPSATLYQMITDFSADGNTTGSGSVQFNQSETLAIQYQVTENNGGEFISEIDGAGTAALNSANVGASAAYEKDVCYGQGFNANTEAHPVVLNGKCANNTFPNSTPVSVSMDTNPALQTSDPTQFANMDTEANGALYNQGVLGSTFGVYDATTLNGGSNNDGNAVMAATGAQENDFVESATSGAPEPGTFVLLGGALVGLGALRRRKKTA
jgi:hypothetical protein